MKNPLKIISPRPSDVLLTALLLCLVLIYGQAGWVVGSVSVLVFTAATVAAEYIYRYTGRLDSFPYIRVAYILVAIFITLDAVLAVYAVAYGNLEIFLRDFMIYFTASAASWVSTVKETGTALPADTEDTAEQEGPLAILPEPAATPSEAKDPGRLTVKKGSSLHIVETDDIISITAMGDYVSITTVGGRYIKEGTMAYYERFLNEGFARIHRSAIVNIAKISTIELYGKQSYSVRLCNGESVKASAAGYKTLKSKLYK